MTEIPTFVVPIVAYRAWLIQNNWLASYFVANLWKPLEKNVARCKGASTLYWDASSRNVGPRLIAHPDEPAPCAKCGCGFYGFKTLSDALEWMNLRQEESFTFGEVYLWGKVIECERGYRAQYAYPKRFFASFSNEAFDRFKVPVEPLM